MNTDLTFITNEENQTLKDRFHVLVKDARFFDVLVGYFFASGFHAIYPALEHSEKIRILVGIGTDKRTYELLTRAREEQQIELILSHAETKQALEEQVAKELEESQDNRNVEQGVMKFIEWIRSGKLEIKAYPSQNIHAKVYIVTFPEGDRDLGRVITGSSNLTQAGLVDNLEFNVELKNSADYKFAEDKFEELWKDAVDIGEKYIETVETKTWLNQDITPYQLYLKLLYEYFKDELSQSDEVFANYLPENFLKLEYQEQAVLNAKKILEEYGGVFISDVVGLGKTYIATLLAGQLDGRTLVIAPPVLLDEDYPGSWRNAFVDFGVRAADFESLGKLDDILERGTEKYVNIIIDEAHRFRTETNVTYEKLAEICRGKRVILVTATPYNNSPKDILSQLKLFQNARKSAIPNLPDLESFFGKLQKRLKGLDRQKDSEEYLRVVRENAREIREKVLKYLMVRRTRSEIARYFERDLRAQGLRFPDVAAPQPLFYALSPAEDAIFNETIELISQKFTYARYTPLLYSKKALDQLEEQAQRNMGKFMKILLVKRLESSFFAFKNSIDRFIHSYEMFIAEYEKGNVYVSKKHIHKIFELLENDDDEAVQRLIDEGKAERYDSAEFTGQFITDLRNDLEILRRIQALWTQITRDPKLLTLLNELQTNPLLRDNKLILFTESKETAEYLAERINRAQAGAALCFTGHSDEHARQQVIRNFDAKARHPQDEYRILVATEVLSEGVNLHRANVVINYDIPWNPTRMMQRVGRINRVDTKFDTIYTFNFFPTQQANDEIKLKEAAEAKINAFLTLLGGDAALLTEGEPIGSHELFDRLVSKKTLTGEDEAETSELKYLRVIQNIRDNDPALFEKIKRLPKKARAGRRSLTRPSDTLSQWERGRGEGALVTYFRRGKTQKFFLAAPAAESMELDFISAAALLECAPDEPRRKLPEAYFDLLDRNKQAFVFATTEDVDDPEPRRGRDSARQMVKTLRAVFKNAQQLTDEQEGYIETVLSRLEAGSLPKQTTQTALKALEALGNQVANPLKALAALQTNIPARLLESHYAEQNPRSTGKREVILSMYLAGGELDL
jgi:superfamily II DNA or RNA helicase